LKGAGRLLLNCDPVIDLINQNKEKRIEILSHLMLPFTDDKNLEGKNFRIQGWWNGRNWVKPFIYSFNYDKFLPDIEGFYPNNYGPRVETMGTVSFANKGNTKLSNETIKELETFLKNTNYKGPVNVELLITESVVFIKDFYFGFISDVTETVIEGLTESFSDLIFETAGGVKKEIAFTKEFCICVRFTIPPFPHDINNSLKLTEILGINEQNLKHLHFSDMKLEEDKYFSGTYNGLALKVTAIGNSVKEAIRRVYRTINNLDANGKQYRTDIGLGFKDMWTEIQSWGWS